MMESNEQLSFLEQSPVKSREGWAHSDMIFYCNNQGFGIADDGAIICLGDPSNIEDYLAKGIREGLNPIQIEVLSLIRGVEASERTIKQRSVKANLRASNIKHRNNQRIRLEPFTGRNSKNFKPAKVRTKPSLHPAGQKQSMLFG